MSTTLPLPTVPAADRPAAKLALLELPPDQLRAWLAERGQPPMRVRQIRRWVLEARATTFEEMSDLPKHLRTELAESFTIFGTRVERHLTASDGTHKLVLRLHDDRMIECVLIQDDGRATACVSTQVGCAMGCVFCASGLNGVARNLTSGEIVEQLVRLRNLTLSDPLPLGERVAEGRVRGRLPGEESSISGQNVSLGGKPFPSPPTPLPQGERGEKWATRLTHIVVMGMGEPLANLDNLLDALTVAGDKHGLGIGARHVTISTVGLPPKMRRLADLGKQYHLAVSLHAPNDPLRTEIVPTNEKTGIPDILAAADYFFEKTGRQVTYEYVVLGKLNDQPPHAKQLAGLLRGRKAHVNLIPWNDVDGLPYRRPADADLNGFIETLQRAGVSVKVRKRKGSEIDAACGQLRREAEAAANRA